MGQGIGVPRDETPNDLARLREHARAAKSLSEAKAAYADAVAADNALSEGEHPDVLSDSAHDVERAAEVLAAARAVERRAYIAYTNPFGVDKHA